MATPTSRRRLSGDPSLAMLLLLLLLLATLLVPVVVVCVGMGVCVDVSVFGHLFFVRISEISLVPC